VASTRAAARAAVVDRVPPHLYFLVSAVFHYLGPAFAVLLFTRVDVLGVAWLRIATAGLILALWRRPWRIWGRLSGEQRRVIVAWAATLAVMNSAFYLAIDRLPLGTVAAIEFLPVVALAAVAVRTPRNVGALALAAVGVYLLVDVRLVAEPWGFVLAAVNAALFALYIVLGHRVSRFPDVSGLDSLALSMLIATAIALPVGVTDAAVAFTDPLLLGAAVMVGICSSVIPYVTDQLAMARLARATYALLVSLLPAAATLIGIVVLAQVPTTVEVVGVLLVVAGVTIHRSPQDP
jgi:inner membrane transporter RhtA